MSTLRIRRFAPAPALLAVAPERRERFLAPWIEALERAGLPIPRENEASPGLGTCECAWWLAASETDLPENLREALVHLDLLADEEGHALLLAALQSRGEYPPARDALTPADLAAELWLAQPELVRKIVHWQLARSERWAERWSFAGSPAADWNCDALALQNLAEQLRGSGEGTCENRHLLVTAHHWQHRTWLLVRWGEEFEFPAATRGKGATRQAPRLSQRPSGLRFRPERHDLALLDHDRGELELWARSREVRQTLRLFIERWLRQGPLVPCFDPGRVAG